MFQLLGLYFVEISMDQREIIIGAIDTQLLCLDVYKTSPVQKFQWLSINVLASMQIQLYVMKILSNILKDSYYQHEIKAFTTNQIERKGLNATSTHTLLEDGTLVTMTIQNV